MASHLSFCIACLFVQYWTITPGLAVTACKGSAEYSLTFQALWSRDTHPNAYVSSAHFSSIIGASHNASYKMWGPGQLATLGIKNVAETGGAGALETEITEQINMGYASNVIKGPGLSQSPGSLTNIKVTVNEHHTLVSVVTMIAPSPDWFVGVHDTNLCDETTAKFKGSVSVGLGPWDSGTDSGKDLQTPNIVTNPAVEIFLITNTMDTQFKSNVKIPNLAVMTFTKISESVPTETMTTGIPTSAMVQGATETPTKGPVMSTEHSQTTGSAMSTDYSQTTGQASSTEYDLATEAVMATEDSLTSNSASLVSGYTMSHMIFIFIVTSFCWWLV